MPHRRQKIEETSRKKGRPISPEVIEELLGFAGPGAIKRILGVPGLAVRLSKSVPSKGRFPAETNLKESLKNIDQQFDRIGKRANVNRPVEPPAEGAIVGRMNVGGKKPPLGELESLALRRQQRGALPSPKDLEVLTNKLQELGLSITGIIRLIASKSNKDVNKMILQAKKELLASPPKPPKGSK